MKKAGIATGFFSFDPTNQPPTGQRVFCLCGIILEITENERIIPVCSIDKGGVTILIGWVSNQGCPACGGTVFVPKMSV